jgi:hypothetical protein
MNNDPRGKAEQQAAMKQYEQRVRQRAAIVQAVHATDAGKQLFASMRMEFSEKPLKGSSDADTNYNVGQRDVVHWLDSHLNIDPNVPAILPGEEGLAEAGANQSEEAPRG